MLSYVVWPLEIWTSCTTRSIVTQVNWRVAHIDRTTVKVSLRIREHIDSAKMLHPVSEGGGNDSKSVRVRFRPTERHVSIYLRTKTNCMNNKIPISMKSIYKKKCRRLLTPTQLFIQGQ